MASILRRALRKRGLLLTPTNCLHRDVALPAYDSSHGQLGMIAAAVAASVMYNSYREAWLQEESAPAPPLPVNLQPPVAPQPGHMYVPADSQGGHNGILRDVEHGTIMKPLQAGLRGEREQLLYEWMLRDHPTVPKNLVPEYFGIKKVAGKEYLVLRDLTAGMKQPCIADYKLGTRTWEDGSATHKVLHLMLKYPPQAVTGLRLVGMTVHRPATGHMIHLPRAYGLAHTGDTAHQAMVEFLHDGRQLRADLIPQILAELAKIRSWMEVQDTFKFYSSSVLIVYDAAEEHPTVTVRMIDFAHAVPNTKPGYIDGGYLRGLSTLESHLRLIAADPTKFASEFA